jgi:hypothetical protein
MTEPSILRPVDGWTIIALPTGGYTLTRASETVTLVWRGRRYRCSCGERGCCHPEIVRAAQTTPTPPGWDDAMLDWPQEDTP